VALPEIALEPGALIVGDLHLEPDGRAERFAEWVAASRLPRLVILGDLFEAWFGPSLIGDYRPVLDALRAQVDAGTAIDVIPGNRDFLLDAHFEAASGAQVRPEGMVGVLPGGERVLCIHGDELCTNDHAYQRLRRVLRSGPVLWLAPRMPAVVGRGIAARLRSASRRAVPAKPAPEKAQVPAEAAARALAADARAVVCGHAHRQRDDALDGGARWLVVDAFGGPLDAVRVEPDGGLTPTGTGCEEAALPHGG
jgi:UDP-2,3-diacylglucosamine hydrolase